MERRILLHLHKVTAASFTLTFCVSMASSLLSSPSRSELTSLRSSLSLFQITWTFSWASRHSLPWAWLCSEVWDCNSRVWGLVLTSSWADRSWRDDTLCCELSSSRLICCRKIKEMKESLTDISLSLNWNISHFVLPWHKIKANISS